MRTYLLFLFCCLALPGIAQDRLVLTDGQEVLVWITEVGENYLKYIHADHEEESEFNIPKRMVSKIIYATGDEKMFRPVRPSNYLSPTAKVASSEVKIESITEVSQVVPNPDQIHMMNGGIIEAAVTEITDLTIEYKIGTYFHKVPVAEVASIKFGDGSEEQFFLTNTYPNEEAARKASQVYRKIRTEAQALEASARTSAANSSKGPKPGTLRIRLLGGLNLITGIGGGKRDLGWTMKLAEANLPPNQNSQSSAEWNPTVGIHLGLMAAYTLHSEVNLIGGIQISQKGFISLQNLSYQEAVSGNRLLQISRVREQMVYVDIPLGVEIHLNPFLELQAGLLTSLIVNGKSTSKIDTEVFGADGTRLEDASTSEETEEGFEGMSGSMGGFVGVRIPLSPKLGIHLRALTNQSGGYEGALSNTVIQFGASYEL